MTILLVAQAGVPFTSGFIAKFGVIRAAVDEGSYLLAVIAMVASVIAAFLYLRIIVAMWMTDAEADAGSDVERLPIPLSSGVAISAAVGFTIVVGLFPSGSSPAEPPRSSPDEARPLAGRRRRPASATCGG